MTNSLIRLEELPLPDATVALTTADVARLTGGRPLTEPEGPVSLATGITKPRERRNPGDVAGARDRSGVFAHNCTEDRGNVKGRG